MARNMPWPDLAAAGDRTAQPKIIRQKCASDVHDSSPSGAVPPHTGRRWRARRAFSLQRVGELLRLTRASGGQNLEKAAFLRIHLGGMASKMGKKSGKESA
jgi:hypothetical protein